MPVQFLNREVADVPLDALEPHPDNPNVGHVEAIAESIETVGFYDFVVAQRRPQGDDGTPLPGRILAGEHRWRALRSLGAETCPVVWLDVDDETATRILLADNQHARRGRLDEDRLARLIQELEATDLGTTGLGFEDDNVTRLLALAEGAMPGPGDFAPLTGSSPSGDDDDDGYSDGEDRGIADASDATLTVGEFRARIPRHAYEAWRASMREAFGYAPADILAGIFERLAIKGDVLPATPPAPSARASDPEGA